MRKLVLYSWIALHTLSISATIPAGFSVGAALRGYQGPRQITPIQDLDNERRRDYYPEELDRTTSSSSRERESEDIRQDDC